MKRLFSLLGAALMLAAVTCSAQLGTNTSVNVGALGGVVYLFNGGTNNLTGATTNSYTNTLVVPVSQHAKVGLFNSFVAYPSTATNGNVVISVKRSYDNGNNYETTPYTSVTNALPTAAQWAAGSTNWTYLADLLSLDNATHIQVTATANTGGATAWLTNFLMGVNLNNNTVWTTPAPK